MNPMEFHGGFLQASFQAGILAAVLLTLRRVAGHRVPARLFCIGWCLVALRLVLLTVPAFYFNPLRLWVHSSAASVATFDPPLTVISIDTVIDANSTASNKFSAFKSWTMIEIMAAIWIVGIVAFVYGLLRNNHRINRLLSSVTSNDSRQLKALFDTCRQQCGLRRDVGLAFSKDVSTPALIGWFRPTVVLPMCLPDHLDEDEMRCVFLHELIHVRRHDIALNWLASVLQALHWFNPLLWLAFRCWRSDREVLCDQNVLQVLQKQQHPAYLQTLLTLLECADRPAMAPCEAGLFQTKWELSRRISFMTTPSSYTFRYSAGFVVILALTATAVFTRAEDKLKPEKNEHSDLNSLELEIYDVSDLLESAKDFPLSSHAAPHMQSATAPDEGKKKVLSAKIQEILDTDKLSTFEISNGKFLIMARPATHLQIGKCLRDLREQLGTQIVFDLHFLAVDTDAIKSLLEKHPDDPFVMLVDQAEINTIKEAAKKTENGGIQSAPHLTVFNGQCGHVKIGTYPGGAKEGDIDLMKGVALEVKPVLSSDLRYLTIKTKALMRTDDHTFQAQTTFTQPDGATSLMIMGGVPKNGRMQTQCVLVRSRVVIFDEP